jgi:hypothetical protein
MSSIQLMRDSDTLTVPLWSNVDSAPRRIALFHLDSLCCLPALDCLFAGLGNRIGLVISSDRFGGRAGGLWRQVWANFSRCGVRFTFAMGFEILAPRVTAVLAWPLRVLLGRRLVFRTLAEHARQAGASYLKSSDINGEEARAALARFQPDLVISFHFDQIFRSAFLREVGAPVLNVHPALLPEHRGPCPSFWVLAAGETESGVTIHRIVDETIDRGEPVGRALQTVRPGVSMSELDTLLFERGAQLLVNLLNGGTTPSAGTAMAGRGRYETLPGADVVQAAREQGVRLWPLRHMIWLLTGLAGFRV